jgi:hypothetical protein
MEHYKLVEHFDVSIDTTWNGFEIMPTQREIRNVPLLTGTFSALTIFGDTLSGANSLTVRITEDVEGDRCIIGDTQVGLCQGITTSTKTSSVIKIEIDVADTWPTKVWIKTDTGTVNIREIKITWRI